MPAVGVHLGRLDRGRPMYRSSEPQVCCLFQLWQVNYSTPWPAVAAPSRRETNIQSAVSVLTDLVFALLPIPILWTVQLNWRVKSIVAGILSLGILYALSPGPRPVKIPLSSFLTTYSATIAAIIKISFLSNYGKHGDFLFDSSDLTIWYATSFPPETALADMDSPTIATIIANGHVSTGPRSKSVRPWWLPAVHASSHSSAPSRAARRPTARGPARAMFATTKPAARTIRATVRATWRCTAASRPRTR